MNIRFLYLSSLICGINSFFVGSSYIKPRSRISSTTPTMSVIVFGATGGTGKEVVVQALKKNENVVAFCRDVEKLTKPPGTCGIDAVSEPIVDNKLIKATGTVTSQADVDRAFSSAPTYIKGVVIALGGKPDEVGYDMLKNGTQCIINSMKKYNVSRVAVVTSIGVGNSFKQAPLFFRVLMMTAMKSIINDKNNQEKLFLDSPGAPGEDMDFTIVRPGGLSSDPPTKDVKIIDGIAGKIPRADVAEFCLDAILDENFSYTRGTPCISSVFE